MLASLWAECSFCCIRPPVPHSTQTRNWDMEQVSVGNRCSGFRSSQARCNGMLEGKGRRSKAYGQGSAPQDGALALRSRMQDKSLW